MSKRKTFAPDDEEAMRLKDEAAFNWGCCKRCALDAFAPDSRRLGRVQLDLSGGKKLSRVLTELFQLAGQSLQSGYLRLTSDRDITAYAVFGTHVGTALSAILAQVPARN